EIRQLIIRLSKEHGKTILISSHLLNEIQQMATRMLIIHKGQKVVEGLVNELLDPADTIVEIHFSAPFSISDNAMHSTPWMQYLTAATPLSIHLKMNEQYIPDLNNWLVAHAAQILEIRSTHSLESYFLSLTNDAATKA
ncbi:MAG: ABC transporter ATP-binding protein, partial [Bacteroidota bacterium]